MTQWIDDDAAGEDVEKQQKDDARLAVRFTIEKRLNQALMTRVADNNAVLEARAELMEQAGKFDDAKAERAKKISEEPAYREVEFVSIMIPGDKTMSIHRPVQPSDRRRFRAKYEAWKNSAGKPFEGTPIEQLPDIKQSQIKELQYFNVPSIEALAEVADGSPLFSLMGGQSLKQRAKAWLAKNAKVIKSAQDDTRDAEIAELKKAVQALLAERAEKAPAKAATK